MSAANIMTALHARYQGEGKEESHVLIPEARAGAGDAGNRGQLDLVSIGCWQSVGLIVQGHEVKVSRSDWLRELKNPAKTERFMRYCHRFWLVVPAPWQDIVKDGELPESWGLMQVKGDRATVVKGRNAPRLDPEPLPWSWQVGWMAQLVRPAQRADRGELTRKLAAEYQRGLDAGSALSHGTGQLGQLRQQLEYTKDRLAASNARVDVLAEVVGDADLRSNRLPRPREIERIRTILALARIGGYQSIVDMFDQAHVTLSNAAEKMSASATRARSAVGDEDEATQRLRPQPGDDPSENKAISKPDHLLHGQMSAEGHWRYQLSCIDGRCPGHDGDGLKITWADQTEEARIREVIDDE